MCWLAPFTRTHLSWWLRPLALIEIVQGPTLPAVFGQIALLSGGTDGMKRFFGVAQLGLADGLFERASFRGGFAQCPLAVRSEGEVFHFYIICPESTWYRVDLIGTK